MINIYNEKTHASVENILTRKRKRNIIILIKLIRIHGYYKILTGKPEDGFLFKEIHPLLVFKEYD
jgi:hypothetical protein